MHASVRCPALTSQPMPTVEGQDQVSDKGEEAGKKSSSSSVAISNHTDSSVDCEGPVEVSIDETYQVLLLDFIRQHTANLSIFFSIVLSAWQIPGVGFVVAGTVVSGKIDLNDILMLGPDLNGAFVKCTVR